MQTLTPDVAGNLILAIFKGNAPVRKTPGATGKRGTNMFSPYPGNLRNNGIRWENLDAQSGRLVLSGRDGKVGYLPFTETTSKSPGWQEKSLNDFVNYLCSVFGGIRV